jgi:hypothetical protein
MKTENIIDNYFPILYLSIGSNKSDFLTSVMKWRLAMPCPLMISLNKYLCSILFKQLEETKFLDFLKHERVKTKRFNY